MLEPIIAPLEAVLRFYEGLLEPFTGSFAWGWSIILLTFTVRLLLVPLAVRQTKSMRAMQQLQPEIKKIQKKYKADRSMLKTDPDRYKQLKEKQREATMELYQEHQVNPAGGCLPLLLQMPIFFALFRLLNDRTEEAGEVVYRIPELADSGFFGIDTLVATPTGGAGIGAWALVFLQVATTYISQKQMQGRNPNSEQAQQQKILLYVMPVMLGFFCLNFPTGLIIYWVATNLWTMGQQWIIFRNLDETAPPEDAVDRPRSSKGGSDRPRRPRDGEPRRSSGARGSASKGGSADGSGTSGSRSARGARDGQGGSRNGRPRSGESTGGQSRGGRSSGGRSRGGQPRAQGDGGSRAQRGSRRNRSADQESGSGGSGGSGGRGRGSGSTGGAAGGSNRGPRNRDGSTRDGSTRDGSTRDGGDGSGASDRGTRSARRRRDSRTDT